MSRRRLGRGLGIGLLAGLSALAALVPIIFFFLALAVFRLKGHIAGAITLLLSLWRDRERPSRDVKAIADRHVADLDRRIAEMQAMADTLRRLSHCCAGDDRPDCPILADLTQGTLPADPKPKSRRAYVHGN